MCALFVKVWVKVKAKTAGEAETDSSGQLFVLWGTHRVHLYALTSTALVIFNLFKISYCECIRVLLANRVTNGSK